MSQTQHSLTLTYVNGRGRAEAIRFVMAAADLTWNERFLESKADLDAVRAEGHLMFGQVPLLEIDGQSITQSSAIIQHVARVFGLYGTSESEATQCDMIYDAIRDSSAYVGWVFASQDPDAFVRTYIQPKIDKYFPMFDALLAKSTSGFLVGAQLTFVDALLLNELEWTVDLFGEEKLQPFANLASFRSRIRALPVFERFLASALRKPVPDPTTYVPLVRAVFS
jgi:glutathione S-transferase